MRSVLVRRGAATLFAVLVTAYGGFGWWSAESRVLAAAEAEGRATLQAVAAGVENGLAAGNALETLLRERLEELIRVAAREVAAAPGREDERLARFARTHRLRGALWLDQDLTLRASSDAVRDTMGGGGPFSRDRMAPVAARRIAERLRAAGLAPGTPAVLGFDEPPFGDRQEFLVASQAEPLPGFVVLRQDVDALRRFEERAGITRLLTEAALADAVDYLALEDPDGRIVVASDPALVGRTLGNPSPALGWRRTDAGTRVLDVVTDAGWSEGGERLRVGLAATPVETLIERQRAGIGVLTLLVLATGLLGLGFLERRERIERAHRQALERELADAERLATLGRLAGGVAHEVRGPLNALSMAAQRLTRLLRDVQGAESERAGRLLVELRGEVERMERIVADFLVLGRDAPPLHLTEQDVGALVESVVAREAPGTTIAAPEQPVTADLDVDALSRALANLVRNAVQITPPEDVSVAWWKTDSGLVFEVRDRGPGLTAEQQRRVFEPFWSERPGGTGLGLALARDAVERHGGELTVRDRAGGGTIFAVSLPMPAAPPPPSETPR